MRALVAAVVLLLTIATYCQAADNRHAHRITQPTAQLSNARVPWYSRSAAPQGWTRLDAADHDEQLTFTLIVKGSNADELERRFWSRSDPDSDEFGQWMTNAEIEQLVAPSTAELQQLYGSLAEHGIAAGQVVSRGDSFDITASVQQAASLFATRFYHFKHAATGLDVLRQWGDYSLPAVIAEQTELVLEVHTFPTIEQRLQRRARRAAADSRARAAAASERLSDIIVDAVWVPPALAAFYGVPHPIAPLAYSEVSAGVIQWDDQTFSPDDLSRFSDVTATPIAAVDPSRIIGNNSVARPGIEATLDIQMYTFTVEFLTAADYPSVISMSYGVPELDNCNPYYFGPNNDCDGISYQQYQHIVNKQFMKIGLLGVTIVSASSDQGVYSSDAIQASPTFDWGVFEPNYPGSSPYVTTCGETEIAHPQHNVRSPPPVCNSTYWQCVSGGDEQAASLNITGWLSGGGFSNVTLRPAYQSIAVDAYLRSGVQLPDQSLWNSSGRAIPDVTAQGRNGYVVLNGRDHLVGGSSMATPIIAAIFALLNHDYYAITNSTLGFLNPLLYKAQGEGAGLFTDITVGDNCADEKCEGGHAGFECTKGWDPVSGLGSPSYPSMKKYVQQLGKRVMERRARKLQN